MESSKVQFNEVDESFFVDSPIKGLAAISVRTVRGPFGCPDNIITSWTEFAKLYGPEVSTFDGPTLAKRALGRGAMLRVNKIGHYTSPADATTLDAITATINQVAPFANQVISMVNVQLFLLTLKYPGADYNNITVQITAPSNGNAAYFNIVITHATDSSLNETYQNITIPGNPAVKDCHFLDDLAANSPTFNVTYFDLSSYNVQMIPTTGTWAIHNGSDGTAPGDNDYIGSPVSKVGVNAFDQYNDFEAFAPIDNYSNTVLEAYGQYAQSRKDCVAFLHLPNTSATVTALQSARTATTIDDRHSYFIAGGLIIPDPLVSGATRSIAEVGDVLGAAMASSKQFGPWYSFAGANRGFIQGALGVVNNFTTTADLDLLANYQINVVNNKSGTILIRGNFSGQLASSRKSFMNVVKLIIFIEKSLAPIFDGFIEEPNDFRTFSEIYNEVRPFLDSLKGNEKRALVDYDWQGDQFANQDSDLKINNRDDLDKGKYHVKLSLKEVVSMQVVTIDIISTASGTTFTSNLG